MSEKKYPIGGYAPGNYQCHCTTCGGGFIGDKRAYQCESCALRDREKFDALSPVEQEELMKRNAEAIKEVFKNGGKKPDDNLAIIGHGAPNEDDQLKFSIERGDLWKQRAINAELELDELKKRPSAAWVKASERLPLHKAFWNMPGKHNNNECYFPVRIDGHKYRVGEIYDERQSGAPDPVYMFVINGDDYYEKDFHRIEWLDEAAPSGEKGPIDFDELWDEHSELIDDDIDGLSRWAGSVVMTKEMFLKAFKQKEK